MNSSFDFESWQRVLLSASPRSLLTQTALCSNRNSASESVSRLPFYRGTERDGLDFLDLEDRHTYSFYSVNSLKQLATHAYMIERTYMPFSM